MMDDSAFLPVIELYLFFVKCLQYNIYHIVVIV